MKHRSIHLTLLLWSFLCIGNLWAYDFEKDGIYYNITSSEAPYTVEVTYSGTIPDGRLTKPKPSYDGTVTIPSSVSHAGTVYSVTAIGDDAFSGCAQATTILLRVDLPSTIQVIGKRAFHGCLSLVKVNLPESLVKIDEYAFAYCRTLEGITLPSKLETIETSAFTQTAIRKINLPNSLTTIGYTIFADCDSLKTIEWPTVDVTWNKYGMFEECDGIEELNIPKNIPVLEAMFRKCQGLKKVTLDETCSWIGSNAFYQCQALETVDFGEAMIYVHEAAFRYCEKLKSVVLPNTTKYIDRNAFSGCTSLSNVKLGEYIETMGDRTFADCTSLTSIRVTAKRMEDYDKYTAEQGVFRNCRQLRNVVITQNVEKIRSDIFAGCTNLETLVVEEGNPVYDSRNNCNALIETATNTLKVGTACTLIPEDIEIIDDLAFKGRTLNTHPTFPKGLKEIRVDAFSGCSGMAHVILPQSLTKISGGAFSNSDVKTLVVPYVTISGAPFNNCANLVSIDLDCQSVGNSFFAGCTSLKDVKLGNNLKSIEGSSYSYPFDNCTSLQKLTLPASVERISNLAFVNCKNLNSLRILRKTPPTIDYGTFSSFDTSVCTLHVPAGTKAAYEAAIGWSAFKEIKDDLSYSPFVLNGINYKEVNDSVLSVIAPNGTVYYSPDLVIPGNLDFGGQSYKITSMENAAFADYADLTSVSIPETVTEMGANIFFGCNNLEKIYCQAKDPSLFDVSAFDNINTSSTVYVYVPRGTINAYRKKFEGNSNVQFICLQDAHVTQTGLNTLSAEQIKQKADNGILFVSLQNHTTSSHNYINHEGKMSSSFSIDGATTWEVVKCGEGYALKDNYGRFLKGTTRPAQFTYNISEATLYMPEDAQADIADIAEGYNSSMAVRWKVLPEKAVWINTNGATTSTTIQWNNGTGCWTCLFTYEVSMETEISVTYVLMEDGKEIDRQTKLQLSHSSVQLPDTWDQHLYDYTTDDNIGQYDCTIVVTRTHKTKVYEREFFRQSSVEAGKTYAIFNTAVNGTENRYGFYYAYSNWQLGCNPVKPSEFPNTDDYLWVAEDAGSELIAFKNKSNGNYINASQRTLGASTGWKIEEWTTSAAPKASVNSMNENEEIISNSDIKDSDRVFTVTNPDASGRARYWNGNDITGGNVSMPALWDRAHPFAFYSWQDVLYVFNTYILQECDGTEVERIIVKQKAFSPLAIPTEWTSNLDFTYTTSGTVGDDGSVIIVTRTSLTTVILDETVATELTDGMASSVVVKYTAKTGWNTFTMPFNMSSDDMTAIFGNGWRAYELKSFNNGELGFKTSTDLYAGHAYIVYSEEPGSTTLYKNNVNLIASPTFDSYNGATFYATYAPMPAGTMVGKYGITNDGHIAKGSASAMMRGYRGYIELPEGISDIRIMLPTGEVLTSLNTSTVDSQTSIIYDLQGRKLTNSKVSDSQMKGVFISNGKKVLR